ncbi:MAG: GDP-mannose 4,6-dehydratase [Nitrospirae bacterium]|nr:GDP-mannose 4,6-dehydratase [Nitrospirota bacterium]MBI3595223.1 GDP-mannose 4,6-dehydratase [Nitrospirota bacterium]
MKKVLITGISGFVGSHLAEFLLSTGKEVYGTYLEDESLGLLEGIREKLILRPCLIQESEEIYQIIREISPDEIYHLAGMAFVVDAWQNPKEAFSVNALGTMNLYEAVVRSRLNPWILSVLSADVYGIPGEEEMPLTEERILRPIHPYGLSKATADLIGYHYFYAYNLPIIRVRPFNHIGPRQSPKFVCSDFAWQIARIEEKLQEPFIEVGNLDSKRDFTDVRDMVRAYGLLIEKGRAGEVYHVSSEEAVPIHKILSMLLGMAKVPIEIRTNPTKMRRSDSPVQIGDCSKLKKETGWNPAIPLKKTLEDLLNYWRNQIAIQKR